MRVSELIECLKKYDPDSLVGISECIDNSASRCSPWATHVQGITRAGIPAVFIRTSEEGNRLTDEEKEWFVKKKIEFFNKESSEHDNPFVFSNESVKERIDFIENNTDPTKFPKLSDGIKWFFESEKECIARKLEALSGREPTIGE